MYKLLLRVMGTFAMAATLVLHVHAAVPVMGARVAHVSIAEVERFLGKPGVYVFDVNLPELWEKHHLVGAIHVEGPNLKRYLPADIQAIIIFYCAEPRCRASESAAEEAIRFGYNRVYVMPEGIFGWIRAGKPVKAN